MNFSKIYQNTVLTMILACLVVLIVQNQKYSIHSKANSTMNTNTKSLLTNYTPSNFNNIALIPVNKDGTINVNVVKVSDVVDVNIEDISTYDKLNVHLKSTDSYSLRNAGPLEVETD